jgi:hypothetical protein
MQTPCLGVLPTQKTWLRSLLGRKKAHTHKPGKAGVLEHKGLCLTKNLIHGSKKSMQTQVLTQSRELWSEQEVSKIWISSWFLSKSGGLYQRGSSEGNQILFPRIRHLVWRRWGHSPLHIPWPIGYLWSQSKEKPEEMCVRIIVYMNE